MLLNDMKIVKIMNELNREDMKSLDVNVYLFYMTFLYCLLLSTPYNVRKQHKFPRWFDEELKQLLKKKSRSYRMYCKNKCAENYAVFASDRKNFKIAYGRAHATYVSNIGRNVKSDPSYVC